MGIPLKIATPEFLGYQQSQSGEMPRQDLTHFGAYKKGYISGKNHLHQQELRENSLSEPTNKDFLPQITAIEKDIVPQLDRLIKEQGLKDSRNSQLELLGFQDGIANQLAQKQYWISYAYQKGYILGTNRFWHQKFGCFPTEE